MEARIRYRLTRREVAPRNGACWIAWLAMTIVLLAAKGVSADTLDDILIDGERWELVADGFNFTEGPTADHEGRLYFSDVPNSKIYRLNEQGDAEVFVQNSHASNGLAFGPDGRLYACQFARKRVVVYDENGNETVLAKNVLPNDLVVRDDGAVYFTEPDTRTVWCIPPGGGEPVAVDKGISRPNGIVFWPNQSALVVADTTGQHLWTFRPDAHGRLHHKERFYSMQTPPDRGSSGADGMTVDREGRLYVATYVGVQVFDAEGRQIGVIDKPQPAFLSNLAFGGPNFDRLYATSTDKVFVRRTKVKGDAPRRLSRDPSDRSAVGREREASRRGRN